MSQSAATGLAVFLLRVALGIMFLAHSLILKLIVLTLPVTAQFFVSLGLPAWFAYVVFFTEVAAGICLVLGVQSRWAAIATVPILIGATWVHASNGWVFSSENGGWEYPAYLTLLAVVQGLLGDGSYALKSSSAPFRQSEHSGVSE